MEVCSFSLFSQIAKHFGADPPRLFLSSGPPERTRPPTDSGCAPGPRTAAPLRAHGQRLRSGPTAAALTAGRGRFSTVLFGTPIYQTAVDTCWHLQGYKTQIAVMRAFLRPQQKDQIPAQITAEDMSNLLVQESKRQLWEFKLEDFEEKEAKPPLKLVWAVNVINRMRDVEFQARVLLKFPKATPPTFQNPKLLSMAKKYIDMLKEKQQETQTSRLLTTEEVVIEVVPRVLQGFWELPPKPLLNMASKSLSMLCTSLTKATLDKVSKTVTAMGSQVIFSSSVRDDVVQTILTEIREQIPLDILLTASQTLHQSCSVRLLL